MTEHELLTGGLDWLWYKGSHEGDLQMQVSQQVMMLGGQRSDRGQSREQDWHAIVLGECRHEPEEAELDSINQLDGQLRQWQRW